MENMLLSIGIITILAVVTQVIGLVAGTAAAKSRIRAHWRDWCNRFDSQLAQQVVVSDSSGMFSSACTVWLSFQVFSTRTASDDCKTFIFADPEGSTMMMFMPGQFLMVGRV